MSDAQEKTTYVSSSLLHKNNELFVLLIRRSLVRVQVGEPKNSWISFMQLVCDKRTIRPPSGVVFAFYGVKIPEVRSSV